MRAFLIEDGVAVQKAAPDRTAADMGAGWIDGSADAVCGMLWDGEVFTAPPVPPAYATASEAKFAMTAWIDGLTGTIQRQYPSVVQQGWTEEEAMASAYLAGNADGDQLAALTADATAKSRTPFEHAMKILEKAQTFRAIAAQTRTLWLATEKALDDATDPSQYEVILNAAMAQAAPLAAVYGLGEV